MGKIYRRPRQAAEPADARDHRAGRPHTPNTNLFNRLGKPEAVWLFFNWRMQQIAVQSTSLKMPESFPVGTLHSKSTRYVNAASFCTHFGICVRKTLRFTEPHFSADGKLILDLNKTVIVSRTRSAT